MNENKILDSKLVVRKNKDIIESRYKLKPLSTKLVSTLISLVKDTDTYKQVYVISVSDFKELCDIKGNRYQQKLKEATKDILKSPLHIEISNDKWLKVNWCSSIIYDDGLLYFEISEKLLPYIKELKKNYLSYDLKHILKLKSSYSIRLYELLKDTYNKNIRYGNKTELIVDLIEFRKLFEIPKSYQWVTIKSNILEKSKNDLEKHTDIKFDWEISSRYKRKIKKIKFKIYSNETSSNENGELPKYLSSYMSYVNHLREAYRNDENSSFFMCALFDLGFGEKSYFFGLNEKGYIYAMENTGGYSLKVSKSQAEIIYNASYLCSKYNLKYRDFINRSNDMFQFAKNNNQEWKIMYNEMLEVFKKHDPKQRAMI